MTLGIDRLLLYYIILFSFFLINLTQLQGNNAIKTQETAGSERK